MNAKKKSPAPAKNEQLVYVENNKPITNSRLIAKTFGKNHHHVLRDIENIECSEKFTQSNFGLSAYKDKSGKINKEYHLTKDGFTMLAFGYTGTKAMKFKEDYINRFNLMEQELHKAANQGQKAIEGEAKCKEGKLFPQKLGKTMLLGVCQKNERFFQLTKIMWFVGFSRSSSGAAYAKRLGEGNAIIKAMPPAGKQNQWFINQDGFDNLLTLGKHDFDGYDVEIVYRELYRVTYNGKKIEDESYPYQFTHEQISELFFEVSKIERVKLQGTLNKLLREGRRI